VPFESKGDLVDIGAAVGLEANSIAYLAAVVEPVAAGRALAALASDDAVKVWLNGKPVHENWVLRAAALDQDLVALDLHAGANTLLVKVLNAAGDWAFAARVLGPKGAGERLWEAARDDELSALRTILESAPGVDVNGSSRFGLTAWQAARLFGSADSAALLADRGADTRRPLPEPGSVIDAMLTAATDGRTPGAAVLVSRKGQVVLEKGYGYASLEHGAKVTPRTKFRIGSVTKQFTAAAVLRLQEMGKLSVEDPLSKYRPDFPRGSEVTLRHLLTHTSGIHSYTSKPDLPRISLLPTTTEEHIRSFQNDAYDFDPGARWSYSNSGYFLLGAIVEKVSGRSYADFLREQFFDPLGMKDTGVHTADAILDGAATGYAQQGSALRRAPDWNMSVAGAAGALYSTVEDLARWNDAVFGGKVLSEASLAAAFTPVQAGSTPPGEEGYGYGWGIGRVRGVRQISHDGGLPGFVSHLSRYPDEGLTVAVLVNSAPPPPGLAPGPIGRAIAQLYLADRMEPRRRPAAVSLPAEALERFVGRYDYGNAVLAVTREGDRLFAQLTGQPRLEIFPSGPRAFFWKAVEARVEFVQDANGRVIKAVHYQGPVPLEAPRMDEPPAPTLDPAVLDAYVGRYDYGGGAVILTVTREDGQLFAQLTGQPRFQIFQSSEDQFSWKVVPAKITFVRDSSGKVTGGIHEQGGQRLNVPKMP
jgi:CubicO group peptidase (beta-lactamase class C family)